MNKRDKRNILLQKTFWNPPGFWLLKLYVWLRRRIDHVLLNQSLDSDANGEYWILDSLPKQAVVLDVGFNMGDYTEQVLQRCPTATVHAFDPARTIEQVYQDNFANEPRIHFYPIGLSNECGELEFYDYDNECSSLSRRSDAGQEKACYKVPVKTLDVWAEEKGIEHIDFLKVDAEGFDANVLEGAIHLLQQKKVDLIMFEFASGWIGNRRFLGDVAKLVESTEFSIYRLFNGFIAPFKYSLEKRSPSGLYVYPEAPLWLGKDPKDNQS